MAEWKKDFGKATDESDWQKKIRDSGFRRTIVILYRHRCALCGIRMLTPEGHTIVDAAHVKPWKDSFDDRPTNGMALCKLCHWSFDKGLMSVSKKYEVLVSKRVMVEQNFPGHILTLTDRPIFKPEKKASGRSRIIFTGTGKTHSEDERVKQCLIISRRIFHLNPNL